MVRGTPRAHSSNYIWAFLGGGSASLLGDSPELEFCPRDLSGTQDSSEFRGVGGSLCVREAGRGQARGAGRRRTWVPGAGCAGCGGGGRGVASPAYRAGFACMCGGPRLPAPFTLQVRAGRLGRRAGCGRAKTRAPRPPPLPARGGCAPPSAPVAASPPRPRRALCFEVGTRPSSPPGSSPSSASSPAARP